LSQSVLAETTLKISKIRNNVYMIEGVNGFVGGNVAVSIGEDGVLLVDSLVDGRTGQLNQTLSKLGATKTRYLLNTHWHGDHTGGNAKLSEQATIIAHDNVRKYLQQDNKNYFGESKAAPAAAWPVLTFDSQMTVHFNDDVIKLKHYPNGHTNGDAMVYFKKANVLHMGDEFFKGIFPFVDLSTGGSVVGLTANINRVIKQMPADVLIIPGHGTLANIEDLKVYRDMLEHSIKTVKAGIAAGMDLAAIQHKGLGQKMIVWSKGFIPEKDWIEFTYLSLQQQDGKSGHSHGGKRHHH
jgi:glyoxylase-like metal-dependent hydrolase (beta-lactamase superfamily II)